MLDLTTPVEKLAYVGSRNAPRLKRLGLKTVKNLLWHFPNRYEDFSQMVKIGDIREKGQVVSIIGTVSDIKNSVAWRRRMAITNATVTDDTDTIRAVWFNQPYLESTLKAGTPVSLSGKVALDKNGLYLSSPMYEKLVNRELTHTGRLVPIYSETEGVSSKYLRLLIKRALAKIPKLNDPLPQTIKDKYNFPELTAALNQIHFPQKHIEAEFARQRFAFEELLLFQLRALRDRRQLQTFKAPKIDFDKNLIGSFVKSLPFELTGDQRIAAYEILKDLEKNYPMNRLLNGDVGSGKTVVALIAAVQAAARDYQAVFMAPTEILAKQHYQTISSLISNSKFLISKSIRIGLLTSSEKSAAKKQLRNQIARGEVDIVIGTHAVIQKNVQFARLGLVVIDEQHRFGVEQRAALVRGQLQTRTQTDADKILYKETTYKIRSAIFNVRRQIGLGHKESIYQKALEIELKNQNIQFNRESSININYNNERVGIYRPDFIIENEILVELKALPFVGKIEKEQIWHYLKASTYKLALLINFSPTSCTIDRIIYDKARLSALCPHLLSMTATPIPRTLALTIYGDLDVSLLKEKPKGRQEIITRVVPHQKRRDAYKFIEGQARAGRQVFVICPRIESSAFNSNYSLPTTDYQLSLKKLLWAEVKAVTAEYEKLSKETFPQLKVAMLHGQMKPKEKDEIMAKFREGHYDLLVSTSVVEVGVDIPNATVMMIESADRFGLAQLHQFRGRVGRGEHQSYCLLFTSSDNGLIGRRLKALEKTNDGFELAETDLKIRGPGEFVGVRQSGIPDLAMTSLSDLELIKKARLEAKLLLKEDPSLGKYPALLTRLSEMQRLVHFE